MNKFATVVSATVLLLSAGSTSAGPTFDAVKAKGYVQCGVNGAVPGLSAPDSQGIWKGIDINLCGGIAAPMFGDADKVRYAPVVLVRGLNDLWTRGGLMYAIPMR
ncbi:MAG TPA: hypothetical protein VF342_14285 [Alphaproteobacteria bacterium]